MLLADVEINGKTSTLRAFGNDDLVMIMGVAVQFRAGRKIWQGTIAYYPKFARFSPPVVPTYRVRGGSSVAHVVGIYDEVGA
jgi:hypothetical protein